MLLLDTHVLSELMRSEPDRRVVEWVVRQPSGDLFTAAVCQAEILAGLAVMAAGRRRTALEQAARSMFSEDLEGRVLPFDAAAALAYADIFAARRGSGRSGGTIDLMVAAIAHARGASVVTRNVSDFDGAGVGVVDPWAA